MGSFTVQGGPNAAGAQSAIEPEGQRQGASQFRHCPDGSGFVIAAASILDAFAPVTAVFRAGYGDQWGAEVGSASDLN